MEDVKNKTDAGLGFLQYAVVKYLLDHGRSRNSEVAQALDLVVETDSGNNPRLSWYVLYSLVEMGYVLRDGAYYYLNPEKHYPSLGHLEEAYFPAALKGYNLLEEAVVDVVVDNPGLHNHEVAKMLGLTGKYANWVTWLLLYNLQKLDLVLKQDNKTYVGV